MCNLLLLQSQNYLIWSHFYCRHYANTGKANVTDFFLANAPFVLSNEHNYLLAKIDIFVCFNYVRI